jgi:hypothetical protein
MRARGSTLVLSLLLLLPAPASAAAPSSFVPTLVMDDTVPAYVSGAPTGAEVTLEVGDASATKTVADGVALVKLAGMTEGLHEWSLSILANNVTTTTHGFVLVDTRLEDIYTALALDRSDSHSASAIANLTASLNAFEARLKAGQKQMQANLTKQLVLLPGQAAENVTVLVEGNLSASGATRVTLANPALRDDIQRIQATSAQAETVANGARSVGIWAAFATLALALCLFPLNLGLMLQARKARRETLVFLLVLSARAGITPDSPEFQQALAAFDGKKPKVPKQKPAPKAPA